MAAPRLLRSTRRTRCRALREAPSVSSRAKSLTPASAFAFQTGEAMRLTADGGTARTATADAGTRTAAVTVEAIPPTLPLSRGTEPVNAHGDSFRVGCAGLNKSFSVALAANDGVSLVGRPTVTSLPRRGWTYAKPLTKGINRPVEERRKVTAFTLAAEAGAATTNGAPVVRGEQIHKSFGDNLVLDGIDFEVATERPSSSSARAEAARAPSSARSTS